MQISRCAFVVALMLSYSLASADDDGTFHVETIRKEKEDVLMVTNNDGEPIATINVHPDDEYQLIKPDAADDHVCLAIRLSWKEQEQYECYERVPFPIDGEDVLDLSECDEREIFLLQPKECYYYVKREDSAAIRQKRRYPGYTTREELRTVCKETERYCKKWGWLFGRHKCKYWGTRCKRYQVYYVTTVRC